MAEQEIKKVIIVSGSYVNCFEVGEEIHKIVDMTQEYPDHVYPIYLCLNSTGELLYRIENVPTIVHFQQKKGENDVNER